MRTKGINYDTGFLPGGRPSRTAFDPAVVAEEMRIIAEDLHCTGVRISGGDPERLSVAGRAAAAAGLRVWFSPFPCELTVGELRPYFAECADRAEELRAAGAEVVLVTGCELSLFARGFLPGETIFDRLEAIFARDPAIVAAFGDLRARTNAFLTETAQAARARFGGRITYASGPWEDVDWTAFDIVSADAYRAKENAGHYAEQVRGLFRHGKPVAVTEFGCCAYRGAADRGSTGWMIVDRDGPVPRLNGHYERDEDEQVRYLTECLPVLEDAGVEAAFWFTFAGYELPHDDTDPMNDLDLAAYGVVKTLPAGRTGTAYPGLGWEPKRSFHALADAYRP
jgi:hypothetical protein